MRNFLDPSNLLEENYKNNITSNRKIRVNESYVNTALDELDNFNKRNMYIKESMYKSLLESDNTVDANKTFITMIDGITSSIEKTTISLNDMTSRCIGVIKSKIDQDLFNEAKDAVNNIESDDTIDIKGFKFTNINFKTDVPNIHPLAVYNRIKNIDKGLKDIDSIKENNSNTWEGTLRSSVISKTEKAYIGIENYGDELFKLFRDNKSTPESISIDITEANDILNRYASTMEIDEHLTKTSNTIIHDFKRIEQDLVGWINEFATREIVIDGESEEDELSIILIKNRISKLESMINIYTLAFAAKLDAIKDSFLQDTKVLQILTEEYFTIEDDEDDDYDDKETLSVKYENYITERSNNQSRIINYISECICLESEDINRLQYLNESALDGIKTAINKIMQAVRNIWEKFMEKTSEVFQKNITYIDKYKEYINKPVKSRDVTMYKYDTNRLLSLELPTFDFNNTKVKDWLNKSTEDAKDTFVETFIPNASQSVQKDDTVEESIYRYIRGEEEVTLDMSTLPLSTTIRDFVYKYKENVEKINKNKAISDKSQEAVNKILDDLKTKENKPVGNKDNDINPNGETTEENSVYSNVYSIYINEFKIDSAKTGSDDRDISSNANTNGMKDQLDGNKSGTELAIIKNNATTFFSCCASVVSVQLTLMRTIEKEYMKLLYAHVSSYVGTTGKKK